MSQDKLTDATENQRSSSRRHFIKSGGMFLAGGAMAGSNAQVARSAHAYGSDVIKIGLVGCGRRGIQATVEALNTGLRSGDKTNLPASARGSVELVAIADVYQNNLHSAFRTINGQHARNVKCNLARFHGPNAYQGVMESEANVVILATPPFFRPMHLRAAIQAGKHVFMERPVAVDVAGIKEVLSAGKMASQKGLAVQVGLQRRHEQRYRETIDQLQSGIIGDVVLARTYCNVNRPKRKPRQANESTHEYQIRNWQAFQWLGGDLMVEQHVQNLDVINWLMNECPVEAQGYGGYVSSDSALSRERSLDYQCAEFTYSDGTKLLSQCRRTNGCWNQVGEHVQCSRGSANISDGKIHDDRGKLIWKSDSPPTKGNGWQSQQFDLFDALRRGERPNETMIAAKSTMTAILGQIATLRNGLVRWDDAIDPSNYG